MAPPPHQVTRRFEAGFGVVTPPCSKSRREEPEKESFCKFDFRNCEPETRLRGSSSSCSGIGSRCSLEKVGVRLMVGLHPSPGIGSRTRGSRIARISSMVLFSRLRAWFGVERGEFKIDAHSSPCISLNTKLLKVNIN